MTWLNRRKYFLKIADFHFCSADQAILSDCDVAYIVQAPHWFSGAAEFKTILIDLLDPAESIIKAFAPNVRNEIRRFERDGDFVVDIQSTVPVDKLRAFEVRYNKFAESRGIPALNVRKIHAMLQSGELLYGEVSVGSSGETLATHLYFLSANKSRARLYYSWITDSREVLSVKQLAGRANRYLHWREMQFLKESGYGLYDLGGISGVADQSSAVYRIDAFKRGFGGHEITEYTGAVGVSLVGKMLTRIML